MGILNKLLRPVKYNRLRCCSPSYTSASSCTLPICVCVPVPPPPPPPPPPPEPDVAPEPHRRSSSMRVTGTTYRSSVRGRSSDDLVIGTHLGMGTEPDFILFFIIISVFIRSSGDTNRTLITILTIVIFSIHIILIVIINTDYFCLLFCFQLSISFYMTSVADINSYSILCI